MTTLPRFTASNYVGPRYEEYFVFLQQNRDSDALTRSNFKCGLALLGGESDTVLVQRHSHWACGWVEFIFIHQDASEKLAIAEEINSKLEDYPVVDESDWSEMEWEECQLTWENMSIKERVEVIQKTGGECNIFAARHDWIPQLNHEDYLR